MKHIVSNALNYFILHLALALCFVCGTIHFPENLELSSRELYVKRERQSNYKWLTDELYTLYYSRSRQYSVSMDLALAVIQGESGGKNIRSHKRNRNKTHDYGRMQINSIHSKDNPELLLNDIYNSKYGFYYLSKCIIKSKGNNQEAVRFYNQGINGKRYKYNNWKYVNKILKYYNKYKEEIL